MRQPTLFARAAPRLDHQVYSTASGFSARKLSTQPRSWNSRSSQARSCGRQPEFFWFEVQFLMSARVWTMFQSPQITYSRPLFSHSSKIGVIQSIALNLNCWRSSPDEPEGTYSDTTLSLP